jgi:hypothetical protein
MQTTNERKKKMESEQVADVLAETREYIEEHGWIAGELILGQRVCIMGGVVASQGWFDEKRNVQPEKIGSVNEVLYAVWKVLFPEGVTEETLRRVRGSLTETSSQVVRWNDTEPTTEQDVLDVLAKAEKVTRAGFDPDA